MIKCHIDIETRSCISIDNGVDMYVSAPDFKIVMVAYAIDDGAVCHYDLTKDKFPEALKVVLLDDNIIKVAHNATFEIICLNKELGIELNIEAWECSMQKSLMAGLPGGLGKACEALNLPEQKSKTNLINWFCTPQKKKILGSEVLVYRLPKEHPDKWKEFISYNIQDVEAERGLDEALHHIEYEKKLWIVDFYINRRGVQVDKELIEKCIKLESKTNTIIKNEIKNEYHIENPNSVPQIKDHLEIIYGLKYFSLDKDHMVDILADKSIDPDARKLLMLRQEMSGAATKKYKTMLEWCGEDNRIRGMFRFYGANRTGRWAGSGPQPHNLFRSTLDYESLKYARELVKLGDDPRLIDTLSSDILSQLTRTVFIGNLSVIDFSSIECRVLAWLAGEQWANAVFASHGKIYEAQASKMYGVPLEAVTKELRSKGKVATLALGYQGSVGALEKMGFSGPGKEDIVNKYRAANQAIFRLWSDVEAAVKSCIKHGKSWQNDKIEISSIGNWLTIKLPSGRKLYYYGPHIEYHKIFYYWKEGQKLKPVSTYGGKLVENIVQAIARDILAVNLLRLRGERVVMHIHDEIVVEDMPLEKLKEVVERPIKWAQGLVIKADGFETDFYYKE